MTHNKKVLKSDLPKLPKINAYQLFYGDSIHRYRGIIVRIHSPPTRALCSNCLRFGGILLFDVFRSSLDVV